ncbi:MAG: serine hydrolase [Candidatus Eremiobacteraeota bacterium]|nr:serine hydrolase [Candidatus Eremiobacteraeota bacterium]
MSEKMALKLAAMAQALRGTMGFAIKSLEGSEAFYHRAEERFHAASIIKMAIAGELYRQIEKGLRRRDETVRLAAEFKVDGAGVLKELHDGLELTVSDLAALMIVVSDNTASNMLIDLVGMDQVNSLLEHLGMTGSRLVKKFMLSHPDPSFFNYTTPRDTLVLLEKIYRGEFLSHTSAGEVLGILERQQYREKIPLFLPEELRIAHKTGEVTGVRHDAGIVLLERNPYVICLFTRDLEDPLEGDRVIAEISREVFHYFSCARG